MIQNKIFIVKQKEDKFILHDKINKTKEYIHFDKFKGMLIKDFGIETIDKAFDWMASSKEILLDLDKKQIALIKNKTYDFSNVIKQLCSIGEVKRSLDLQMLESLENS